MHDAQIRVAIAGAGGRMGRQLIQAALQMEGVALGAALEREGGPGSIRYTSPEAKELPISAGTTFPMAHTAAIVDRHADVILVGDSLGMVMHGMETTVGVPLDLMVMHGRAVVRGTRRALVVVDMPFGSYEEDPAQAFRNAARLMAETGAQAVKLEGGLHMAETVAFLTARGIPVRRLRT